MKNLYILLIALFAFTFSNAQIVDIPDANFKNALVNDLVVDTNGDDVGDSDADTNNDGEIQVSEAEAVLGLFVPNKNIESLEGIQSFTNLEFLSCVANNLTSLDTSQNINLKRLASFDNQLTNLTVNQNQNLEWLSCSTNPITNLDVSNNQNLVYLYCHTSELFSLDVSQNPNLEILWCYSSQLHSLNVANGNNINMSYLATYDNPNLTCIQVDNVDYANSLDCSNNNWCKDDWASYNEDCPDGILNIPDSNLLNALVNTICADLDGNGTLDDDVDTNNDGLIQINEAEVVFGLYVSNRNIASMEGIHSFINLTSLDVSANQLTSLNIKNGNSNNIINFNAIDNAALLCIEVDDVTYANNAPNWVKDSWASYSEDCNLGVEDNVLNDFNLYPNPVQDVLNIESQQQIEAVKIYNLQGQLIKEDSSNRIDVSNLNTGLYFVQVTVDGKSITRKFLKE